MVGAAVVPAAAVIRGSERTTEEENKAQGSRVGRWRRARAWPKGK